MRVDAHHHLWDPARRGYPFLGADALAPVRRAHGLDELATVASATGVDATVLVQSLSELGESVDHLDLAHRSGGLVAAVVGWADLTGDVPGQLDVLRSAPGGELLRGLRHPVQAEPDPTWLDRAEVRRGLRAVDDAGLAFDLLVKAPQWEAALRLVQESEAPAVLDHAGNPPVASGDLTVWERWVRSVAAAGPHVSVKLSGLVTLADWSTWTMDDLRPVVAVLLEAFGPDRVMAGSDWPICELAAPAEEVWRAHEQLLAGLGADDRDAVLGGNAAQFYSVDDVAGSADPSLS